ncbi:unnamed protein product, partial [Mesorhabditis spiculigera]
MGGLVLLLLLFLPFARLRPENDGMISAEVVCDVTGWPWHPVHDCKRVTRIPYPPAVDEDVDWGIAYIEEVNNGDGTYTLVAYEEPPDLDPYERKQYPNFPMQLVAAASWSFMELTEKHFQTRLSSIIPQNIYPRTFEYQYDDNNYKEYNEHNYYDDHDCSKYNHANYYDDDHYGNTAKTPPPPGHSDEHGGDDDDSELSFVEIIFGVCVCVLLCVALTAGIWMIFWKSGREEPRSVSLDPASVSVQSQSVSISSEASQASQRSTASQQTSQRPSMSSGRNHA